MTKYSMIGRYSSLCNLWYWLLVQSYVIRRSQSICAHGKILKKRPFCSTGGFLCYPRCSEETLVKGARLAWSQSTHVHAGTSSHHYYSGQPIFWSYLLWMSKEEDQMYAARGMHAFNQERALVSLGGAGGERFLTWWSQGAEDLIYFFLFFHFWSLLSYSSEAFETAISL